MKTLLQVIVVVVCLAVMAIPAFAGIEKSSFAPAGSTGFTPAGSGCLSPMGCGGYAPSHYPGSTEYHSRWIPAHWIQVKVMIPGRWIYRPVWIPPQPMTQYRWIQGFWQTTGYNVRPDVYVWGAPNGGFYGVPYNMYQTSGGGYFTPQGVWVPNNYGLKK